MMSPRHHVSGVQRRGSMRGAGAIEIGGEARPASTLNGHLGKVSKVGGFSALRPDPEHCTNSR